MNLKRLQQLASKNPNIDIADIICVIAAEASNTKVIFSVDQKHYTRVQLQDGSYFYPYRCSTLGIKMVGQAAQRYPVVCAQASVKRCTCTITSAASSPLSTFKPLLCV